MFAFKFTVPAVAAIVGLVAFGSFALAAQTPPPQQERRHIMHEMGHDAQIIGNMLRGRTAYNAGEAQTALSNMADLIQTFTTQFPAGSETGYRSKAAPAIWTNRAQFDQDAKNLQTALLAAEQAAPQGQHALGAAFHDIANACNTCHHEFRTR